MGTEYNLNDDWYNIDFRTRRAGWRIHNMHYHKSYEMYFMLSGNSNILINDRIFSVCSRDVVLLNKNSLHKNNGGTEHSRFTLNFSDKYLEKYFTDITSKIITKSFKDTKITLTKNSFKMLVQLLHITRESETGFAYLPAIASILNDPSNTENIYDARVNTDPTLDFINKHYRTINELDDISDALHTSKSYLCQKFKKDTGMTITDYLNSLKIKNACELIMENKLNTSEIAIETGYNSVSYFCKIFKRIVNMTPREYRKYCGIK